MGEPINAVGILWESTANSFNLRTPDVFLSREDIPNTEIMSLLKSYIVNGCYIWVSLDDYSFLTCFKDLEDINIKR